MALDPITAGIDLITQVISKVLPDPAQKADALLKLEELKQTGELAKLTADSDIFKAEVADRTSARTIHTSFVDVLAVVCICASAYVLYQALFIGLSAKISDMVAGLIIGVFTGSITQILNYYFGSSSGSQAKSEMMNDAMKGLKK